MIPHHGLVDRFSIFRASKDGVSVLVLSFGLGFYVVSSFACVLNSTCFCQCPDQVL